jgi:hypothetical protein
MYDAEADLLSDVKQYLEGLRNSGYRVHHWRISTSSILGWPDIVCCINGKFVFLELKDRTGKPTIHQLQFAQDAEAAGAVGGICRTMADVISIVDSVLV